MFSRLHILLLAVLLFQPVLADPAEKAATLEARLKESVESSPTGAKLMLELIEHYRAEEQVFGLIRTATKFSRSQPDHPQRAEVMLQLMEGYAISSRHEDVLTTGRQFLELFPDHRLTNAARDHLATAHERTGRSTEAARLRSEIWRSGGSDDQGVRAIRLSVQANKSTSFRAAAELAVEMVAKLPANGLLTSVGLEGMMAAERAELWAEGLQISKTLQRRQAPLNARQKSDLWYRTGRFESRLGQHGNASGSFRKALRPGVDGAHRDLVQAMIRAKADPAEIEAEARRYRQAYPHRDDRHDPLGWAANAAAEAGELARALGIADEILRTKSEVGELARSYVKWCGDDHRRAEQGLLKLITGNPPAVATLRAVLAIDVYRDGMKDTAKARAVARDFFSSSPGAGGWTEELSGFLYDSAATEEEFRKDLQLVLDSARKFPHLADFQDRVWKRGPRDKNRNRSWQQTRKTHQNDGTARLWRATRENGGKAGQACQELLQKNPGIEQKHLLLARLAYVYRHHLGGKSKETSVKHYETLCRNFPKDLEAAERWFEAAMAYGDKETKLRAANHLLALPPGPTHYDTWWRLCDLKDEAIMRKAAPWIDASAKQTPHPLTNATRIGDVLKELGMEREALAWWKARMDLNPNDGECVSCARRVAGTMEPAARRAFLLKRFEEDTDHHGTYAGDIASIDFKAGNDAGMEQVLKASRARADLRPFDRSGLGEWPARSWLETARKAQDWPEERRKRIYRIVRDLRIGRTSAEAGLLLVATDRKGIDRLVRARDLVLLAESHHESWQRLYPFAQAALARDDVSLAATLLNGLLNSVRSVGKSEMDQARTLLRTAYGKMGSLGADIPADSPIAPLLQIILHLRLGEDLAAEQAYFRNQKLFDTHRHDLPVELILFGAQTHIDLGSAEDHERAEDILRGWLIKFGESDKVDIRDKARVQLLLARNYQRARQYDVARAEFTTVLNIYKDQPEAVEARFGIGETYMAQKVYDQAGELFEDLSDSNNPAIAIRADFLRGVLAIRQDNSQEARAIFLAVLEHAPDAELANETLFNLAEVYGIEQRYLTQLETLRTVGRLGQDSKVWHTPGNALSVVVQDPDLGISRGDTRIPVVVRTEPGNDIERGFLTSGGAGKGIFLTEVPTILGVAQPEDGTLQVTGGDTITVDYPEDFKKQFQFEFLSNTRLKIASDGHLEVASSEIIDKEDESFTENLQKEVAGREEELPRAASRPKNQVKPGNLVYIEVRDGDRDVTARNDKVGIKLTASSGDAVTLEIEEERQHGGRFVGMARTGELPAGAQASDSALDHNALMAIDHSKETAWRSEPDGAAPKSLSVDMKELRATDKIILSSPQAEQEAPVRMSVRGSHDGRFWFHLADFPTKEAPAPISFQDKELKLRIYKTQAAKVKESYTWQQIADLAGKVDPTEVRAVETMAFEAPEEGEDAYFLIWSGPFVQERDGALRFEVAGQATAVMIDGRLELPVGEDGRTVDVWAKRGIHELVVFSLVTPATRSAAALRARENRQSSTVRMQPFTKADFDPAAIPDLARVTANKPPEIKQVDASWILAMPERELRFLDFEFLEYRGEAIAISNVEISGGETKHIPPAENVLELASNDILELAPGDTVTVSYLDEITAGGEQRNKLLTRSLTATYYNGQITPISFDFKRSGGGSVSGSRKELLRIEPGDRIVAEVVDFDLDVGLGRDSVEVTVQVNADPPVTIPATETGGSTGVFLAEIDTAAEPAEGKLVVKQGDKVYLRYKDVQNTFPGHAFDRETVVFLNEPTEAKIQIVASETPVEGSPGFLPGSFDPEAVNPVEYALPLTVEVIDPDQARDSRSTIEVEVATGNGAKARIQCVLSRAMAEADESLAEVSNPALFEGRFVGQVPLHLGDPQGPPEVPADGTVTRAGLGKVLPPEETDPDAHLDDGTPKSAPGIPVLNVLGNETFTASYADASRPDGQELQFDAKAAMASAATLAITDEEYLEPAEIVHVGKKIFLRLTDPDRDTSNERDRAMVRLVTSSGEDETIELEETLTHSGVFTGSLPLTAREKPTKGNFAGDIECFFGDEITVGYLDNVPQTPDGEPVIERQVPVAIGTNGEMSAFSKVYKNEDLAIQTQFHIAESYFELFKSHRALENDAEAAADLAAGRRVLRELREDYPNPKYAPRVSYLLGQFAQEMEAWDEAIAAYGSIVRNHPDHNLAPDAQYKLGQCHEEAGELDEALEAYVTLAGTYPKNPLIANVMLRINEHFYTTEDYAVAATVGEQFLEKFPNHEWTPKMAFRIGQCHYKMEEFVKGGQAFDAFVKRFPDQELTAQALFWAGESYRMGKDIPNAFRRYNRCRWDFPESEAAKYSRGRLALPELLAQFEREANLN